MRRLLLLTIILFPSIVSDAQDTIIKSNGDRIGAKITEVSTTEVKYKKFDFLDGPTYIESKSNIKLIKYSNGSKDEFASQPTTNTLKSIENNTDYYAGPVNSTNKIERYGNHFRYQGEAINERELHDVLFNSKDKHIIALTGTAKDAKKLQYIGFGAIPLGVGSFFFLIRSFSYYNNAPDSGNLTLSAICAVGALSCPVASVYFKHRRNTSNREAIKLYNARY